MTASRSPLNKLGLYVHWPYCARICPYCDFNVYKNKALVAQTWADALVAEFNHYADKIAPRPLTSIYFGGGTPSLAPISVIEGAIDTASERFGLVDNAEITLEANPAEITDQKLQDWRAAGVNRLSLGVQSLRDNALKFLGRDHDAMTARRAIDDCLNVFANTTFDLIYARPDQHTDDWADELGEALALGAPHLSIYQLTIEPGTAFYKAVERGSWAPPDDEQCADMFELAQERTAQAGLPAYETSNHARAGMRAKHNQLYWTYQDYIGIGPGAHGRLEIDGKRIATETIARPDAYLRAAQDPQNFSTTVALNPNDQLVERMSLGLRLMCGLAFTQDDPYFQLIDGADARIHQLARDGLLIWDRETLKTTPSGRRLLNAVLRELLC